MLQKFATDSVMAFIDAQVTQNATKKNQHIKQTINFASELMQL